MFDFQKYKSFTLFYIALVLINFIILEVLPSYYVVSKPMIMASLIGFYISVEEKQSNMFITALIFALLGDVFLLFESDDFFKLGLGCFLLMQILYTIHFLKDRSNDPKKTLITSIIVYGIGTIVISTLWSGLGSLQIPVLVYCIAICTMVTSAIIRKKHLPGYNILVLGVILFLISDAVLAFAKFGSPFNGQKYLIMGTYMAAQYLIVRSVLERNTSIS